MIWREEICRSVLESGCVDIGAIFPPVGSGRSWRWRIWVTRSGHPIVGRAVSQEKARREVEGRFRSFLEAAQLTQIGGGL